MSTGSFAEILREKLEKTDKNSGFSSANNDISFVETRSKESLELSKLHQRLLEQSPSLFPGSKAKMSETPYRRFKTSASYTNGTDVRAKKAQAKANSTESRVTRPKGVAHKLDDKQTLAMSYFIKEKMFLLEDFTADELKKAYRKLALIKHPDTKSGSPIAFLELKQAYERLSLVFKK